MGADHIFCQNWCQTYFNLSPSSISAASLCFFISSIFPPSSLDHMPVNIRTVSLTPPLLSGSVQATDDPINPVDGMEPMLRPFSLVIPFTVQKGEITGKSSFVYMLIFENQSDLWIRENICVYFCMLKFKSWYLLCVFAEGKQIICMPPSNLQGSRDKAKIFRWFYQIYN